jgi:hypothetical protein
MTHATDNRRARAGEQIAWQRHAAAALAKILERAAAEGLPPIAWTVQHAGMVVHGRALAHPMDQRRDDWNAWRLALTQWTGRGADVTRERTDGGGTTRLVDQWERVRLAGEGPGVTVTLVADLYPED